MFGGARRVRVLEVGSGRVRRCVGRGFRVGRSGRAAVVRGRTRGRSARLAGRPGSDSRACRRPWSARARCPAARGRPGPAVAYRRAEIRCRHDRGRAEAERDPTPWTARPPGGSLQSAASCLPYGPCVLRTAHCGSCTARAQHAHDTAGACMFSTWMATAPHHRDRLPPRPARSSPTTPGLTVRTRMRVWPASQPTPPPPDDADVPVEPLSSLDALGARPSGCGDAAMPPVDLSPLPVDLSPLPAELHPLIERRAAGGSGRAR